jgi:HlyD family secretion protein
MKLPIRPSRLAAVLVGLAVVALLVWALLPKPVAVDLGSAERGHLVVTVDQEGKTRVHDRYVVSAPFAGRVLRIGLEPGDPVAAGETVLATFEPSAPGLLDARSLAAAEAGVRAATANLGQARSERQGAAAQHEYAVVEAGRARRLAAEEIVSQESLDSAELQERAAADALRSAEFAVAAAEHELEVARARLVQAGGAKTPEGVLEISSPVDGVVLQRLQESAAVVIAGEPLLVVADPARLEIVSDLLSSDAVKVSAGDRVMIEQWGGGETLDGVVRRVEPYGFTKVSALGVEEQRVNVIVDFSDPRAAWQALGDGYRVELRVVVWEGDVLWVPTSALFRGSDGGWAVFVAEGGRAVRRAVEVGHRDGLHAEVLDGLAAGAEVIVHPSDSVTDGVRVEPRSEGG